MKALNEMTNMDKGEILCILFPEELDNLQLTMETLCNYFIQNEAKLRQEWTEEMFSETEFWFALVKNVHMRIERHNKKPFRNKNWFSKNLFSGSDRLFTMYCVQKYATTEECSDKMRLTIRLLFD